LEISPGAGKLPPPASATSFVVYGNGYILKMVIETNKRSTMGTLISVSVDQV